MILQDPTVEVAVLESARAAFCLDLFDASNVGVVLNVADHLGIGDNTVEQMAHLRSAAAVQCCGVLNADDPRLPQWQARSPKLLSPQ